MISKMIFNNFSPRSLYFILGEYGRWKEGRRSSKEISFFFKKNCSGTKGVFDSFWILQYPILYFIIKIFNNGFSNFQRWSFEWKVEGYLSVNRQGINLRSSCLRSGERGKLLEFFIYRICNSLYLYAFNFLHTWLLLFYIWSTQVIYEIDVFRILIWSRKPVSWLSELVALVARS